MGVRRKIAFFLAPVNDLGQTSAMKSTYAKKLMELEAIAKQIERCKTCRMKAVGKAVPGEGSPLARVMFVGEAPGKTESLTGRPFIGRSGKLLRELILQAGLAEDEVFITSALKYLPEHVTPKPVEIEHGRVHLLKQIAVIKPKIIVLLGRFAALSVLHHNGAMAQSRGQIIEKDGRTYFITYHPAAALYANKLRADLEKDFAKLKSLIA